MDILIRGGGNVRYWRSTSAVIEEEVCQNITARITMEVSILLYSTITCSGDSLNR